MKCFICKKDMKIKKCKKGTNYSCPKCDGEVYIPEVLNEEKKDGK